MTWISVNDRLPCKPGETSPAVLVAAKEFGCAWVLAIAKCFISILQPEHAGWYLDPAFYHLERPYGVGEEVRYWMPIPPPPEESKP